MPNRERGTVSDAKMTGYLLSHTHETGRAKAGFFTRFGFGQDEVERFREALMGHAMEREVESTEVTGFGTKYRLRCEVATPDQRNPCIITVWIVDSGSDAPRLVTAYPAD